MTEFVLVETVIPPLAAPIASGTIRVQLEETVAGGPSLVLSSATIAFQDLRLRTEARLRLELPLPDRVGSSAVEASARILRHDGDAVRPGDLVSPVASPVTSGRYVVVRLEQL